MCCSILLIDRQTLFLAYFTFILITGHLLNCTPLFFCYKLLLKNVNIHHAWETFKTPALLESGEIDFKWHFTQV